MIQILAIKCDRLIEGGSYGGNKENIINFNKNFWNIHNHFLHQNNCLYDDQNILLTTISAYRTVTLFNVYNKKLCTKQLWMKFICFYRRFNKYNINGENKKNYIIARDNNDY